MTPAEDLDRAVEQFHAALDAAVYPTTLAVVEALLAAGWTPPPGSQS